MKTIKAIIFSFCLVSLTACSEELDPKIAQVVVEDLLMQLDNENYDALSEYYTESFNRGESSETRTEKFQKLRNIMGGITEMEIKESANINEFGEQAQVHLVYNVKRAKVSSIETFTVVKEDGRYKVSSHLITN
jgi:uncharacterized protein VirK/YbjX